VKELIKNNKVDLLSLKEAKKEDVDRFFLYYGVEIGSIKLFISK